VDVISKERYKEFEGVRRKKYFSFNLDYNKEYDYSYWKVMVYRV